MDITHKQTLLLTTNEEPIKKTPKINGNDLQILRPKRQAANDEKK